MFRRVLTIGAGALVLAACGAPVSFVRDGGEPRLVKPGKLTMCTNLTYEPFEFKRGDRIVGFDVDIVDLVAKRLGVAHEIVDLHFSMIKNGVAMAEGKCDVAAAGMTITAERRRNIDFSAPYFDATQALLAKKSLGVTSLDDVLVRDLNLAAQASTTGLDHVRKAGLVPTEYSDSAKQLFALRTGQADVIVQDLPVVLTWLKKPEIAKKFEIVASLDTGEQYGIGLKKGADPELLRAVNETIATAKRDGAYERIFTRWFGRSPSELGGSMIGQPTANVPTGPARTKTFLHN
ncbi:substrate-binding periplasmic protein [Nonomuraea lactucae]|uniref:substrate-binding periplasmic protein n=1 Tax=Nonomuraea lactucae TaxID=2249762 RepID=UPI000DE4DF54|nr:ABC transporter substrate-binding protein [Nonomuraea lactucae]